MRNLYSKQNRKSLLKVSSLGICLFLLLNLGIVQKPETFEPKQISNVNENLKGNSIQLGANEELNKASEKVTNKEAKITKSEYSSFKVGQTSQVISEPTEGKKQIVIGLEDGYSAEKVANQVKAKLLRSGPLNYATLEVDNKDLSDMIETLSRLPGIRNVDESKTVKVSAVTVTDPGYKEQWGLENAKVSAAWDLGATGRGITIAIVDTGVDINHPDLKDNLVTGYNSILGTNASSSVKDNNGHGTHVAGIAGARLNSEGVVGVAYEAKIMPIKAMNKEGEGSDTAIADGIIWAANRGANIINLSLGSHDPTNVLKDALAYAKSKGCLLIGAAGNFDPEKATNPGVAFPASDPNVIAVTAINSINVRANYSAYGNEVKLAAPGDKIVSTFWSIESGSGYGEASGSSMASPFVAGEAALIWSANPSWTNDQVAQALFEGTRDTGELGKDSSYGFGIVDVEMALKLTKPLLVLGSSATIRSLGGIVKLIDSSTTAALTVPGNSYKDLSTVTLKTATLPAPLPNNATVLSQAVSISFPTINQKMLSLRIEDKRIADVSQAVYYRWSGTRWLSIGGEKDTGLTMGTFIPGIYVAGTPQKFDDGGRIAGYDAIRTSIGIAEKGFPTGADTVILARDDRFPDALAGAPLAYALQAPIILTKSTGLTNEVREVLAKLQPKQIYLLGGTVALSSSIETELRRNYIVKRLYGNSAYATAQEIAKEVNVSGRAVVASASSFPDALSIASWAARNGTPILLTEANYFPPETKSFYDINRVTSSLVIGGEAVIGRKIYETLPVPKRLSGWSQYDTAAEIFKLYPPKSDIVSLATGENYPDALTGAVLAAQRGSMIVLVPSKAEIPSSLKSVLASWDNKQLEVFGGSIALPDKVVETVRALVQ